MQKYNKSSKTVSVKKDNQINISTNELKKDYDIKDGEKHKQSLNDDNKNENYEGEIENQEDIIDEQDGGSSEESEEEAEETEETDENEEDEEDEAEEKKELEEDENVNDDDDDTEKNVSKRNKNSDSTENEDDTCFYTLIKKSKNELSDDETIVDYFEEDTQVTTINVPANERITKGFMTKYERVRVLGDRGKQLAQGAKPMIKEVNGLNVYDIAKLELQAGVLPFIIVRPLPDGKRELWKCSELKVMN